MDDFNETVTELLNSAAVPPDSWAILCTLGTALALSAVLWLSYRLANDKTSYQPRFAATLVSLALLTTILMDLIQSNLALSLGMLGSLSIVRFRTNIRDPRDIGFIFWSMAIGLSAATGSYAIGTLGSLVMGAFMVATRRRGSVPEDMMLVVRGSTTSVEAIQYLVEKDCRRSRVKAKNIMADSYELVYQVQVMKDHSDEMIRGIFRLGGVDSVNLLASRKAA